MPQIKETPYEVEATQLELLNSIGDRVSTMRGMGSLTPAVLSTLRQYFRIKNIYHSNAIEGNSLNVGETRTVVELGLTITGKPLKDQAEAKNLSAALDFLEELAKNSERAITESDVRQIHLLVLKGINDNDAGRYRSTNVEIGGSQFKPPPPESVAVEMKQFGQWLQKASVPNVLFVQREAIFAASAAHTWFVTIHPFIDGNGRVARLLMNLILMRFGFPIAVVTREDRLRYYDALESSQGSDLTPFVALIAECIAESLEEYEEAAREQRENTEWAKSLASKFDQKERVLAANHYEVWKNKMELLRSLFRQSAEILSATANYGSIFVRDFGMLEFEKYLSLKNFGSAKKTWFFRLDFASGGKTTARYLFFFGSPSYALNRKTDVTLHISREEPVGSAHYEKIDILSAPNVPSFVEIGYQSDEEVCVVRTKSGGTHSEKSEAVCRKFITAVIEKHFGG